jgi:hypothetical protein
MSGTARAATTVRDQVSEILRTHAQKRQRKQMTNIEQQNDPKMNGRKRTAHEEDNDITTPIITPMMHE